MAARPTPTRRGVLSAGGAALALSAAGCAHVARASTPSRNALEAALARIADPAGEGKRAVLTVYAQAARAAADASDARRASGAALSPLDGTVVTIKDLFDVAGEPTRAGSALLADAPPAAADAPVVARLRAAGAVIVGKTNMVEFALSGVGANPHFGTPGNPADRARVPGGSTSGGGVAAADGMCRIAVGTDTGGSTRIPAALCGVVGFKPSQQRISRDGAFPLSKSLDSIGPIARTVADCAAADAVMAGDAPWALTPAGLSGLKLGIPQGLPLADLDPVVAARFSDSLAALARAGARLSDESIALIDDMARLNTPVALVNVEAYRVHRLRLMTDAARIDPFVRARLELGAPVTDTAYAQMLTARAALVRAMDARLADLDALVLPTTPILAPTQAEVAGADGFTARNRLLLRNTGLANSFDLCAISVPQPHEGGLHSGLMIVMRNGSDRRLFEVAAAVERLG